MVYVTYWWAGLGFGLGAGFCLGVGKYSKKPQNPASKVHVLLGAFWFESFHGTFIEIGHSLSG